MKTFLDRLTAWYDKHFILRWLCLVFSITLIGVGSGELAQHHSWGLYPLIVSLLLTIVNWMVPGFLALRQWRIWFRECEAEMAAAHQAQTEAAEKWVWAYELKARHDKIRANNSLN